MIFPYRPEQLAGFRVICATMRDRCVYSQGMPYPKARRIIVEEVEEAVRRLIDMGADPFEITTSIEGVGQHTMQVGVRVGEHVF